MENPVWQWGQQHPISQGWGVGMPTMEPTVHCQHHRKQRGLFTSAGFLVRHGLIPAAKPSFIPLVFQVDFPSLSNILW